MLASLNFGQVLLAESSLSFLCFHLPSPIPSCGQVVGGDAKGYLCMAPWIVIWPGIGLTMAVFDDALRNMLDPRLRDTERKPGAKA